MKEKAITRFNIIMSGVLLTIIVLIFLGVTLAYFSDTKQTTSTYTAGNVKLTLSEAAVKNDGGGNLIEDTSKPRIFGTTEELVVHNYGHIYPGQTIYKDPTITNTGNTDEWIAAKVTLTDGDGDLTKVMGYDGYDSIDIEVLLTGGLLDEKVRFGTWNGIPNVCYNDHYAMIQIPNATKGEFSFYFLILEPVDVGDSVLVFEGVNFPDEWNNSEIMELRDLKINVQAFGVQTHKLESCLEAMTAAFPDQFDLN